MNTIDTRDLIEERKDLKQQILDSFLETFEHYEEMTESFEDVLFEEEEIQSWKEGFEDELKEIEEINTLEDEISSSEWDYGLQLIDEDDFEEYCEDLVSDIGDLPTDLPSYISNNIDWEGVAEDLKVDYSEVEFRGTNYLFR